MENKLLLEAILRPFKLSNKKRKELASSLQLPVNNQADLMFMSAILVSTGTNKNGATFLGSELIKARGSIAQKALDIEHDEQKVIGHIANSIYLDHAGELIDDENMYNELASETTTDVLKKELADKLDAMEMDIGIICVVYKDRFPELASQIENNEWKVSMECYYDDFDIKIGNLIIPRDSNSELFARLDSKLKEDVKLVLAGTTIGTTGGVSRVLRNIRFCGVGIVKNPANDRSIVLEAASRDIEKYAKIEEILQEAASIGTAEKVIKDSTDTFIEVKSNESANVVQTLAGGFFILKNGSELLKDSYHRTYADAAKEAVRRAALDKGNKFYIVEANSILMSKESIELNETSEAVTFRTNDIGNIEEIHSIGIPGKEESHLAGRYGPTDRSAGLCVNFERYVREFPGNGYPGRIVATHWCKMFNKACPVFGADAHDTECLRNKYSHLVNDKDIFDGALVKEAFNPRINPENTELLTPASRPQPPTLDEAISSKPEEGEPAPAGISVEPQVEAQPAATVITPETTEDIPSNPIPVKQPLLITESFPARIRLATANERKQMVDSDFGLSKERQYPINTKDRLLAVMEVFSSASKRITKEQKDRLYNRIVDRAKEEGIDIVEFEKKFSTNSTTEGESDEFGIPRLKQLPLNNREQVIAAMSRFRHLKLEISDDERKHLVVNILRACKKFNIDSNSFRERVEKTIKLN